MNKFQLFLSCELRVLGVHIVCEECIDRGDLTLEKLRRDIIEPSSIEVQGVHRNNSLLSLEREKVIEHSVNRIFWKVCIEQEEL
jgi:hypothetical protein